MVASGPWYIIFQDSSRNCCCGAATSLSSSNENGRMWAIPMRRARGRNKAPGSWPGAGSVRMRGARGCLRGGYHRLAPGLEREKREQRGQYVGAGRDDEDVVPAPGRLLHVVGDGNEKRRRSLGGVEQTRVGGREFRAERVGAGRWE